MRNGITIKKQKNFDDKQSSRIASSTEQKSVLKGEILVRTFSEVLYKK